MPNKFLFERALEYLQQGKYVTIRVKGNSMRPFLRDGDKVVLKPFDRMELAKGIIVLAKTGDQMVLHRVVNYDSRIILLAGDNNLVQHELVDPLDVIATAVSRWRGDAEVKLTKKWRCELGRMWYLVRPLRRIARKLR